ncbi:MAG: type 3 dihydrofolate reductase [Gammaproteobacteria bacterium]|nr:type 3 dihydrofolate reductase [Gammaproteobacteria bacterium]NVK86765.1 type 3 dihydrofolate reductase [Gammaproteobacteria bacterium]
MPIISLVCAMAKNRVIGLQNQMPWHLPVDLKHFKATTMGKPIVMGRKTFESIGKPLPGRQNVVITRNDAYQVEGVDVVNSFSAALELLAHEPEIMITGGGNIYQQALPLADRLYLTFIDLEVEGDAFFPDFSHLDLSQTDYQKVLADENNPYDCEFVSFQVNR